MEVHLVRELPDEVTGSLLSCQFIGAGMKVDQFCKCRENNLEDGNREFARFF